MKILGVDPGTTTTGFAFIEKTEIGFQLGEYGVFLTRPKEDINKKLFEIGNDMHKIINTCKPNLVVIEKLFFQTNLKTGIDVAQARGVIIYEIMKHMIPIQEYTPLQVKKALTGNGQANKIQLQNAIKLLLKLDSIPKPDDAADAIGLAYMGMLNKNSIINASM